MRAQLEVGGVGVEQVVDLLVVQLEVRRAHLVRVGVRVGVGVGVRVGVRLRLRVCPPARGSS